MNRSFSIYLEVARIVATLIVFVAHGLIFYEPAAVINDNLKFGRDGVIIFFVLSGYVIAWCASEKDASVVDFAINRASRIYSVALPAIILGFIASMLATVFSNQASPYQLEKLWLYLLVYLTFTGNFWSLSETPPGNFPYWSLNFEVWYYIIFAAFFYIRDGYRWLVLVVLLLAVGPTILQLFPLWMLGSALYFLRDRIRFSTLFSRLGVLITVAAFILAKGFELDNYIDKYNSLLWLSMFGSDSNAPQQFLGDYFLGVLVWVNFVFALNARFNFGQWWENAARVLASYSFSFYLFHVPVFLVLKILYQNEQSLLGYLVVLMVAAVGIAFLAKYTEHKKSAYRRCLRRIFRQG